MKSFLKLQNTISTYNVICEASTFSDYNVRFEFSITAINEKNANQKVDDIIKELNLKNSTKTLKKI